MEKSNFLRNMMAIAIGLATTILTVGLTGCGTKMDAVDPNGVLINGIVWAK